MQLAASRARAAHWPALIDNLLLAVLPALGVFYVQPGVYYESLALSFAILGGGVLGGAALMTALCTRIGTRVQGPRKRKPMIKEEAIVTAKAMWIAACLMAWPVAQSALGRPTGLVWDLEAAGIPTWRVVLGTLAGVVAIDGWLYLKHRLLHSRLLFGFHRDHHVFRDPTAFAGFAVNPVEALLTFWPIVIVCIPAATHWGPLYFGLVVGFIVLNFYLHCGVRFEWIERTLPRVFLNTSAFHSFHHSHANVNFGEAAYFWDWILGTRLEDQKRAS